MMMMKKKSRRSLKTMSSKRIETPNVYVSEGMTLMHHAKDITDDMRTC